MENYFLAKAKLFQQDSIKYSIINIDDHYGKRLVKLAKGKIVTVSLLDDTADIYLQVLAIENMVTSFTLYDFCKKVGEYKTSLLGGFNLMNLALSIAALKPNYSFKNITNIEPVKGRMEVISLKKNAQIIIDYAHTPDALENVLKTLQQYKPRKLWCIFGCGGNRDTSKRAIMASIAEKYADSVIVTEDNNRLEKIGSIFDDIKKGFENPTKHSFIDSREDAIKYAIDNAERGDIILLAGKGHECYLDKNGNKEYFDEREMVVKYD
jgi:UDP-N-acetylmuramoyl-L-alanyl-D-glutamate--2,6-diaminopimelate ligase